MLRISKRKLCNTILISIAIYIGLSSVQAQVPPEKTINNIRYMSGGIGIDEIDAMRSVVNNYSLAMQFQVKGSGSFLSDVDVSILNKQGKEIFSTKSDGPCLFVDLPPGSYKVNARFDEKNLQKTGIVKKGHHTELYFYWPLQTEEEVEERKLEKSTEPQRHPDCT